METLKVIKIGGNIIDDEQALQLFLKQFADLQSPKVLVHGGGKLASRFAKKLGVEVKMMNGRRITNAETLEVITMVYAGKINKSIVSRLQAHQCNSVGFTGADGNSIVSVRRPVEDIDFGYVGDITRVNTDVLAILLNNAITPVLCAITHDEQGQLLNTNADTIAAEIAIAMSSHLKTELYYCFEKSGVLSDVNDENSVIEHIDSATYKSLLESKVISDGMLPKLTNSFHAVSNKVANVYLGMPEMLFTNNSKFTTIRL